MALCLTLFSYLYEIMALNLFFVIAYVVYLILLIVVHCELWILFIGG